jgi:hypothetical protein
MKQAALFEPVKRQRFNPQGLRCLDPRQGKLGNTVICEIVFEHDKNVL